MLEEEADDLHVTVGGSRVERSPSELLRPGVGGRPVLEEHLDGARVRGSFRGDRAVQGRHLDLGVLRDGLQVGPPLRQQLDPCRMSEEGGEVDRHEPVARPGIHTSGIAVEELLQPLGTPERSRLEEVELGLSCEQCSDFVAPPAVERVEKRRHGRFALIGHCSLRLTDPGFSADTMPAMHARVPAPGQEGAAAEDVQLAEEAVDELLEDLLTRIRDMLRVDTVAVLLLDEAGETLVAKATKGLEEEVELGVRIPVGKGFAGRVADSRRPVVIDDVDHADIFNPLLREKGLKALLGVPIEVEDKLLGVLHVGSLVPRAFGQEDVRLLELVAGRVALPIVQSQLYGSERDARQRLESVRRQLGFLADASAVFGSSLDYETTLASVARLAVPELADWCVIDVLGADGSVRRVAAVCADPAREAMADELRNSYPARPEREEGTAKVLRTARSELVEEVDDAWLDAIAPDSRQREILGALHLCSNILVPLVARGRTLGVLTLATAESGRRYGEAELRLAEELAARAALAVDNARLYREAEETLGLLDTLFATAPVGLAFFDRELRYLKVNETFATLSGGSPEQHLGRTIAELAPVPLAEQVEGSLQEVLETGEPILDRELSGATPRLPEERFWLASYYPVRASDGETVGVGAVVTDLTERTRGERRLSAQYEVTRILSTATSFEQAAPLILRAMCESLEWDVGGFWMLDGQSGRLRLLEQWHAPTIEPAPFTRLSSELEFAPGEGLPGHVLQEAEPQWIPDFANDSRFPRAAAATTVGLHSAFGFPVFLGSTVLGVLEFFGGEKGGRDEELLQMSAAVGSQIGQFIERKRAERESEKARERLTFLAEASRVLASSLDYEVTLERTARLAVPVIADWCAVDVVESDGRLRRVALTHVDPDKEAWARELAERYSEDPDAPRGTHAVLRSGEPLLVSEVSDELLAQGARDEEHLRLLREVGLRSYIAVPLVARERVLGVLALASAESGRVYGEDDLGFAEEVARRAAVAVENASLFRSALENEEQQRFLSDAGTALASSLDFHGTLQRVAHLAVPVFADWCIVDLVEGTEINRVAVAAASTGNQEALEELRTRYPPTLDSPQPAARALREKKPVLFYGFTPDGLAATTLDDYHLELMERLAPRSAIAVPLVARGHTVGAITFARAESGRRYTDGDLPLAEEIARRAALAVDNARLHRETEERARAALVLSHVGDGVFMLDQDGVVRLWNRAAEAITSLRAADVVGNLAVDVIPGWAELGPRVPVAPAPAPPAARRAETLPLEVEERELWLSITGVGLEEGTVYAFRDLTEERALEKMKSDFVSTISHELRTPLASVYGAAVTLSRRESDLDETQRGRLLAVIASEAERLARIVSDILLASRLDSQTLVFTIESCDAFETLQQAVEAARTHLPQDIDLRLSKPAEPPPVAADPEKLRQVLGNVIDNAVKYSPDGGMVEIAVERRGRRVLFSVSDEGIGIPAEESERIFEKFYRLDPELLRGVGGTGLGLYISAELVRRMEGEIWVESELGKGSTFYVELPRAEPAIPALPASELTSEARA
jgi:PAS domain S-box-containing protein